jgi:hypothetical protein
MSGTYLSENDIENVVRGFESCETDKPNFKHRDHLTVAVWYLQSLDLEQAVDRMRSALLRFLDHHSVDRQKYNETITVFWIQMVANKLNEMRDATLVEKCNGVVESLHNSNLVSDYYSKDLLSSDEARRNFVAPDLRPW